MTARVQVPISVQCIDCGMMLFGEFTVGTGTEYLHDPRPSLPENQQCHNAGKRYRLKERLIEIEEVAVSPNVGQGE
jgi:hypothetical protein